MNQAPDRRLAGHLMRHALLELHRRINALGRRMLNFRGVLLTTTALRGTDYRRAPGARAPSWYPTSEIGATHLQPGASIVIDNHHVHNVGSVPFSLSMGRR